MQYFASKFANFWLAMLAGAKGSGSAIHTLQVKGWGPEEL
jgi:hypothetical protein